MGCSIFNIRSGLPHALFRRIHLLAVYAPQPISLKRWKKRVQLDQYGSLAALRLLSSRTSLKETTAMCSYLATERQNKQATNMETAENGGFLGRLPLFSKLSLFLRRRIVFKCSPESHASFTYPFAKNTGENRSLRLFLASLDSNEQKVGASCPHVFNAFL
jgi:hypothetical protein